MWVLRRGAISPRLIGLGPRAYVLRLHSRFTRSNGPWKLVYYEAFLNKEDARREELFLKSGKGKERIKYLLTI